MAFGFYLRRQPLRAACIRLRRKALVFTDKFAQAVELIARLGSFFAQAPVLVVTDSWFGHNGLFKPLRARLGERVHLLSRLRVNAALFALLFRQVENRSRFSRDQAGDRQRPHPDPQSRCRVQSSGFFCMAATTLTWLYAEHL